MPPPKNSLRSKEIGGSKETGDMNGATQILKDSGFMVGEFARYVDKYGMIRFVKREIGEKSVRFHGWREVSRIEAKRIQRANNELNRKYLKPKMKKYF